MRQGPQGTSCVASGKSGLLSSCTLGFLSSCCKGIGPHLELRHETQGSSPVATRILGFLSSFNRGVRPRLVLSYGTPPASRVVSVRSGVSGHLSSCIWNLWLFPEDATRVSLPLSVVISSSGLHLKRCLGIGTYLELTGKSVSCGMRHDPRGVLSSFNVRPASSWGATGRSGSLSRQAGESTLMS